MTFLMILLAVAVVVATAATIRDIFGDRGRPNPPTSHFEDPMFRAPAARI
jgi:hypothetical protein